MSEELTHKEAKRLLSYNPETGKLYWRVAASPRVRVGDEADSKLQTGYVRVQVSGKRYLGHRIAWFLHYGKWPNGNLDHINGDRSDNRIENLRVSDYSENARNQKIHRERSDVGIFWCKNRKYWKAQITVYGRQIHLGCFWNKDEAIEARMDAEKQYWGGYAHNLNKNEQQRGCND